jgi:hypothetical protein
MMAGGPQPHSWSIDEREYTRQESRRGRRYAYEDLEPARTALVVVDMVRVREGQQRCPDRAYVLLGTFTPALITARSTSSPC